MNARAQVKIFALRALARMSGQPMPDDALRNTLLLGFRHTNLTRSEADAAVRELDADGHLIGVRDELTGETNWSLSAKGEAAALRHG
jgi:hypothetical protein